MIAPPRYRSSRASRTFLFWCLLAWPSAAAAAPAILLESHPRQRPQNAVFYLEYLARTLGASAPTTGVPLREAIESKISRAAGPLDAPVGIRGLVEEGRRQFIEGEFTRAIAQLEEARTVLLQHTAALAADQNLRGLLYKALLYLSHAYLRTRQEAQAVLTVQEAIRSYPDREFSLARYGPELARLFQETKQTLGSGGLGSLTIDTQPKECLVFLNERYVGLSPLRLRGLYPGDYRVYLQRPGAQGRVHPAKVIPREHRRLSFNFLLDQVLRSKSYAGFRFASPQEKAALEKPLALQIAAALKADQIMLFDFDSLRGRRILRGRLILVPSGRVTRAALVFLEPTPPAPATLKGLGSLLAEGKGGAVEGVHLLPQDLSSGDTPGDQGRREAPGFFSARVFRWIMLGAGIAGLGAGAPLLALHGQGSCDAAAGVRCPNNYDTLAPGIILTGVGALSACASALFFYYAAQHGTSERSHVLLPWGTTGGGGLVGIVSF